jgi:hypothetical protein
MPRLPAVMGALLALVLLSGCDGCKSTPKDGPRADAAPLSSRAPLHHPKPKPPCTALGVIGDAGVASGAPIAGEWITLGAGTQFTAKHPRTARETAFEGPGRVRVCVGGDEESWLSEGVFRATAGVGEAPMQEEWVATPLGVLRYAQAELQLKVSDRALELEVQKGKAFLHPGATSLTELAARSPEDGGWFGMPAGTRVVLHAAAAPVAKDAVDACAAQAAEAHAVARAIVDSGAKLGELAKEHVTLRRAARASCAVAAVLVETVHGSAREELSSRVREADADWRSLE